MGLIQSWLKPVGNSLWLRRKLDHSHGAECRESFALSACRLRLPTIAAELVSCSIHPCWDKPGDREADVTFWFALGACWVFVFKDETFYHNWVRFWGLGFFFLRFVCSFLTLFVCTVQCLSGSSIHWELVCYFRIFFNSQLRCWCEKNTTKDRHKTLKDSTL